MIMEQGRVATSGTFLGSLLGRPLPALSLRSEQASPYADRHPNRLQTRTLRGRGWTLAG